MRLFHTTKLVWPIGLILASASAMAAPADAPQQAPAQCQGQEEAQPPQGQAQQDDREPTGPLALIGGALAKVCLDDKQRDAIEKIADQVGPKEEAVADAREALRLALADQIKAGKIDEGALHDKIDKLVKAREDASPALRKGLEDIHAILDPGQRSAFVDALRGRVDELKKGAEGWRSDLAKDLKLTDDQKSKIGDVLDKNKDSLAEERTNAGKLADAFKRDDFSIEKILPVKEVGSRTRKRIDTMIANAKELTTILDPEQRAELAKKLHGGAPAQAMPPHGLGPQPGQPGPQATTDAEDEEENVDATSEPLVVARGGYRAGGLRGWGYRGYGYGGSVGGYRSVTVHTGYAAGYPLGGWGPGIW